MNGPDSPMDFVVPNVAKILRDEDTIYQKPHIAHRLGGLFTPPQNDSGYHTTLYIPSVPETKQELNRAEKLNRWRQDSLIVKIKERKEKDAHNQRMSVINAVLADIRN